MREREGEALKKDFQERLATLEGLLKKIEPLVGNIADSIKQRLMEKLAAENIPVGADDDRLLKEVLFYADKSDVTEEITRLHSHFAQFPAFSGGDAAGGTQYGFPDAGVFPGDHHIGKQGRGSGCISVGGGVQERAGEAARTNSECGVASGYG